jgi:hypothetical protein
LEKFNMAAFTPKRLENLVVV